MGAGPTGLMLACELALAGVQTLVLEKLPRRIEQVKGGTIQPRTAELLELRGLLEPMLQRAMPRAGAGGHFAMLPVDLDCTPWQTRYPHPISVPQWEVERVLAERAIAGGASILRDTAVADVECDDAVTVTAGELRVRARYLAACDGARSTVRTLLGLPFPGRAGTYLAVLADIRLSAVSELVPRQMGHISSLTRQVGGYWSMLVPIGGQRYRFTFGSADQSNLVRDTPVTDQEIAAALRAVYGEEAVLAAVDNASRFTDATRQLDHYRSGRVVFAGDAAHIHPPLGGQGLNLGVQDALNLGWKLAAVVQDRAPNGLLDSYHAERHPVAARVLHHTSAQRVLADPGCGEDVAALRDIVIDLIRLPDANRHLAGLMSGLSLGYDLSGQHPLVGRRIPDLDLTCHTGPTRLSALFGAGHAVLLDLAGIVGDDVGLPARVDLVRATCTDGVGAGALLCRPDGYVCWAADRPADCGVALRSTIADSLAMTQAARSVPEPSRAAPSSAG